MQSATIYSWTLFYNCIYVDFLQIYLVVDDFEEYISWYFNHRNKREEILKVLKGQLFPGHSFVLKIIKITNIYKFLSKTVYLSKDIQY